MKKEIVLLKGVRTAFQEYVVTPGGGNFKDISAIDLCVIPAKESLVRSKVKPEWVDHVVIGNALQTSGDALYGARHVSLKAGIPIEVPALTISRLCGSGIQSVITSAQLILLDEAKLVLAGGMENMSQAPHILRGAREGIRFGISPPLEDSLMVSLMDTYCGLYMAQTAEKVAGKYGITRAQQDEFALRSHLAGAKAVKDGIFDEEIVPVAVKKKKEMVMITKDDHIKPETTIEALSKLPPAFGKDGTVTAGNASGIVDGAACIPVTTRDFAKEMGLPITGRIISWAVKGVPPDIMGIGPVPAIREAVSRAGLSLDNVDLFEINEAFAAQYLSVEKELELDRNKVNVQGGAIALGHPLAASGTRLIITLLRELKRRGKKIGVASACIGGGQGIAIVIESL